VRRTFTLVNRIASACGSLFTFAVDQKIIKATPMPKMTKGKGPLPSENEKGRDFSDSDIRRVWLGIDSTRMDARAEGKDPIEARDAAARAIAGRMTVAELIAQYESIRAPSLKSGGETIRLLKKHVEPVMGALAVADVGEDQVHAVLTKERARLAADDANIQKADAARRKEAQKAGTAAPRALKR
jgi:hypothetical protein